MVGTFDLEHQSVKKSLHLVREYFRSNLIRDQGLMESEKGLPVLLKMLEDPDLISSVQEAIDTVSGSERRWEKLTSIVSRRSPPHVYKLFPLNCKVVFFSVIRTTLNIFALLFRWKNMCRIRSEKF